jgi:hypothetical protein
LNDGDAFSHYRKPLTGLDCEFKFSRLELGEE